MPEPPVPPSPVTVTLKPRAYEVAIWKQQFPLKGEVNNGERSSKDQRGEAVRDQSRRGGAFCWSRERARKKRP
ncbi:hypothetical protein AV530_011237 [Patagioenas fasciata monilis]|uniref:Uncharacterized protein n=1 Tax=Patagioenas fasciata monilis TaxID=372326 RepID=A0A1V4KNP1_PATFA|nr:hypothetical protein AV530_011237 [Patagioenas fasciata monilis]